MADVGSAVIAAADILYNLVKDLYTVVKDLKPSDIGDYEGDTEMLALSIQRTKDKLYNIDEQQLDETQKVARNKIREVVLDAEDTLDRVETLIKKKKLKEGIDLVSSYCNKADDVQSEIKKITIKLDDIQKYLKKFGLQEQSHRELTRSMSGRASGSQVNAITIMGRDGDKREVIELLLKPSVGKRSTIPVVAIVGMGGMGKTTLAQLVFDDEIWQQGCNFDLRLWVSDSKKMVLKSLLKSILKSISPSDSSRFDSLEETQLKDELVEKINGKRFLLVLDDVENENRLRWTNLEVLLSKGTREGSRVLVTTRSKEVADTMGASASTHKVKGLSEEDSLQLFESYAFDETTDEKLVPIGKRIVEKCAGVPLALKVIGALMYQKTDRSKWERMVSDLGKDNQIMTILKMSYDNLDSTLKQCFSYCALFPKKYRISKETLISIWKANVHFKKDEDVCNENWKILCNRCFLEEAKCWYDDTYYQMHDLMHDLAKTVAGTEMLGDFDAMEDCNKLIIEENVRHLSLLSHEMGNSTELSCELKGRSRLRTFIPYLRQPLPSDFDKTVLDCPVIRFLDLHGHSVGNLTDSIGQLIHLRYLNLSSTDVHTLNSVTELINLMHLNLEWCKALTHLPSGVDGLISLEMLDISCCVNLEELPMEVEKLTNLRHLNLEWCEALTHLPSGVGGLKSLEVLNISRCSKLEELPMEVEKLTNLRHLNLQGCKALTHLPSGVGGLTSLQVLDISCCVNLEELPMEVEKLTNLRHLNLERCMTLTHLPSGLGGLTSLETFDISRCINLEELPMEVKKLTNLRHLNLERCKALTHLPSGVGGLISLEVLDIYCCVNLEELPMEVEKLTNLRHLNLEWCEALTHLPSGVGGLKSLEVFDISWCAKLEELPMEVEKLTKLKQLNLNSCYSLTHLPSGVGGLKSLEVFNISWCDKLEELPMEVEKLTKLKHLNLNGCYALTHLPSGVGGLASLEVLDISKCTNFKELPMEVENLTKLKHLNLSTCDALTHLPSGVGVLTSLEVLDISRCENLEELPMGVEKLTKLKHLNLSKCALTHLPFGVGGLISLEVLDISSCYMLKELPFGVGGLTSLKVLDISWCSKLKELPMDVEKLSNLQCLKIEGCWDLTKMPSGIGALLPMCSPPRLIVGHPKSKHTAQLEELDFVSEVREGELQIELLANITLNVSTRDGEAFLVNKKWLRKLLIMWREEEINHMHNPTEEVPGNHMEEDIMVKLQPPPTLEEFKLDGYQGTEFPTWVPKDDFASALPNLQEIRIFNCQRCRHLHPLSRLPLLKRLELIYLSSLEYIEEDVSSASFCPSLEELKLYNLPELKGWCRQGLTTSTFEQEQSVMLPSFPHLVSLDICSCPNLMVSPILVSFVKVFSVNTEVKKESSEKREEAMRPMSSSTAQALSSFSVCLFDEICRDNGSFKLCIDEGRNHEIHLQISGWEASSFPPPNIGEAFHHSGMNTVTRLQHLTALQQLNIGNCGDFTGELEEEEEYIISNSLQTLKIDTPAVAEMTWQGLPSLEKLTLSGLPNMERLPEEIQFLTSLQELCILGCDKLTLPEWVHTTFKHEHHPYNGDFYRRLNNS